MSVSITIPIAASTSASMKPASTASAASATPATSTTLTAAQLAKETINQLQTQANKGSQLARREIQRREKLKEEQSGGGKESSETSGAPEAPAPQEPGKGTQIDKAA